MVDEASVAALFYPVEEQGDTLGAPEEVKEEATPALEVGDMPVEEVHLPVPPAEEAVGEKSLPSTPAKQKTVPPQRQPKGQHSAAKRKSPGNKPAQKRKHNR